MVSVVVKLLIEREVGAGDGECGCAVDGEW